MLPGFPCKSPNNITKVLGEYPDGAEEVSIQNISRFLNAIKSGYPIGAEFNIISDGYVFGDVVGVPDNVISKYARCLLDLNYDDEIRWYALNDFFPEGTIEEKRSKLVEVYGISAEELDRRIHELKDVIMLYNGMQMFMREDKIWGNDMSRKSIDREVKSMTRQMMIRNEAYSNLIDKEFSDSIRVSIHPSTNNGHKYSINLVSCSDGWSSPWHRSLAVTRDRKKLLIKRVDAESAGFELRYKDEMPYYFQEP